MDSQIPASLKNFSQTINFKGCETQYSVTIVAQDVLVHCSPGSHSTGSSKVQLTNVVDYNWEQKYYTGHLLAVHIDGKFFAYGIKARNSTGKGGGMVRVANQCTKMRALIREMNGQVQDLAFAHIYANVILACVDEEGGLFVYNIEEKPEAIVCTLMLHVVQSDAQINTSNIHRVVWCPYLPEEDDGDDDVSKLLVLTHGNKAELLNINIINCNQGVGPLSLTELSDGYLEINEHNQPITDAAFSPDGTAVATASMDGFVKFFQIYMHEGTKPRCLHEWQPHDGKPLSCLSFLDNHNIYSADEQFWKFAVTGCNNNTEIKVWSCESWTCLQTLRFLPNPNVPTLDIYLKVRLDLSAGYLLLSDINNRILYILEMHRDRSGTKAYARTISEFLLPAPFLSFGILEATLKKFRGVDAPENYFGCEENEDFEDVQIASYIKMFVVSPKRLQECEIAFQTSTSSELTSLHSPLASKNLMYHDTLADLAAGEPDLVEENTDKIKESDKDLELAQLTNMLQNEIPKQHFNDLQNLFINQLPQTLNLMTPDAFNSPVKNDSLDIKTDSPNLISISSPDKSNNMENKSEMDSDLLVGFQRPNKENFASGGSSPSREVQEILSLNNSTYSAHEYYEDEEKISNENREENDLIDDSNDTYQPNLNSDGWPSIPIMKAKEVLKAEENRLSENLDASLNSSLNHKSNVHVLQQWIVALMSLVRDQNSQLQHLQNEVKNLKLSQEKCSIPEDLENIIAKQLDLALARSHAQQSKLFEHWANTRAIKDRENQETLSANMSHVVTKHLQERLQTTVNMEMKQTVLPVVVGTFENLKHLLQEDFVQKMSDTEQSIKDSLNKFVSSKTVAENLSTTIVNIIQPSIEMSYKDMVASTLLPSWEKACSAMFQQIHETFTQGTKEYTTSVESYMEKHRRTQEKGKELVTQMQNLTDLMRNNTEKLTTTMPNDLQKQMLTAFVNMQDKLMNSVSESVKEQITVAFRSHAAILEDSVINAVKSRAVTPSPHVIDTQVQLAQIQQLLAQGHINTAFQQALSASDLSLVVYICERLNPHVVFNTTPCPLQQHVLLSLIQQLSADMTNHTDLKHKYLEEAVLNLDPANPVTKEHMSTVLRELNRQLTAFISSNPNNKVTRNMKMLQMATQSLLKN